MSDETCFCGHTLAGTCVHAHAHVGTQDAELMAGCERLRGVCGALSAESEGLRARCDQMRRDARADCEQLRVCVCVCVRVILRTPMCV